ncbi:hypothetical protein [Novosphingobium sp.]|uniref:hypothetical protein n=1 Tax=Novosphingobium sp. TaxID=1874826 RepID=UPI0025F1D076|nr:hypothetical protein [Novosphingobium sp.]MCC6925403.1 hypothetical protein [Novosphingobium sp.]
MSMSADVARIRISRELNDAEDALNEALLKQTELFASLVTARRDTNAKRFEGQDALLRLSRSQQSLLSAGGDLARVHGRLLEIDREMGGPATDCPDNWREPMKTARVAAA